LLDLHVFLYSIPSIVEPIDKFDDLVVAVLQGLSDHAKSLGSFERDSDDRLEFDPEGLGLTRLSTLYFWGRGAE
jgi:hypothetical protein